MQFIGVFFRLCQKSFLPPDSMIVAVYHVIESIRRGENTVLPCAEVVKWDSIFILKCHQKCGPFSRKTYYNVMPIKYMLPYK